MADKPSRALVLYGDGFARSIDSSHTHIHSLASKASCGFLSLPNAPPSESKDERIVREFALLLDACDAYFNTGETHMSTVSERFMGMRAAVLTDNLLLKSFGSKIGLAVLELKELVENNNDIAVSSKLMKLLGFQEGKVLEKSQFDLVFVHMEVGENFDEGKGHNFFNSINSMNAFVGDIIHMAQPGSEIGARLHLSIVMSYGIVSEANDLNFLVMGSAGDANASLAALFPRQSYTMNGEKPRTDVRNYCPMLIAQWQDAVTRKDMVEAFSFNDFKQGGNLVIPTDRFLHEVAFKLWKAPKYGA